MSLNGQTQTYMPPTLDGLNVVEADQIYINGIELDTDNLVTYTGATKTLNMGAQAIKTTYAPIANADVVNLLTLQNAVAYIEGINVANFVPYTNATADTNLGNKNLTVGNAGQVSFSNLVKTELNNVLSGYNPASITVGNNFGSITNAAGVYQATSTAVFASLVLGSLTAGEKYSVSLSLKSVDVGNTTNLYLYGSTTTNMSGSTGQIVAFNIPPNTTGFTVFTNTITFPVGSTYLLLVYYSQKPSGIDTLYWNAFSVTGMGSVVKNLIAPTTSLDGANKAYVDLRVPYTGATSNVNLGSNSLIATTAQFTGVTSATPALALGVDVSGNLRSFAVPSTTFPVGGTTNINGSLQTLSNPLQYNSNLDANSYFITGVAPTTYTFTTNWTVNPVSGTTANIALDPAVFYFSTSVKYVISFTGIYGTSASWTGTVFNNSTSTTVSDASIAITTTPQNLVLTFTPGSNNPTIYLRFVGASGTLRFTNFTLRQMDTEVMGNLIIDSQIQSDIIQTNGKVTNLANALKVNQTSVATATSLTTASLPAGVSASTLSGTYTLTATAGGATFGMWLGSSFTYTAGSKYTYTFTGFSTNATATQAMILYTNTYTGGSGTMIGDYVVNVPITSSTVSGSFTATSNNNVVWNFVASATGKSISFTGFTLTRADTQITGVATLPRITGTATAGLGLNASNQIVTTAVPTNFSAVSIGYVPYESATDTFSNSLMTQGSIDFGASLSAWTGIGSITYSAPTYTANSSSSVQGIINITPPPYSYIGTLCTATFTNLSFPLFALSPYPYFTLTSGSTIVYTSGINPSGTISIPFTSSSSLILFITIYFKAPPAPFTGSVLTWTNFTLTSSAMITTGNSITTGSVGIGITNPNKRLFVKEDILLPSITSAQDFPAQVAIQSNTSWLKLGQYYQSGVGAWGVIQSSDYYSSAEHGINLGLNPLDGKVSIGGQEMSGVASRNPGQALARLTIHSDYGNSASGFCINASDSSGDNYYMSLYPYVVGSGVVGYNFLTFNASTSYSPLSFNRNLVGINQTSPSYNLDVAGNQRVINGDDSFTYYGANTTWGARLAVGSGTEKGLCQVFCTDGNLHLDCLAGKTIYLGYHNANPVNIYCYASNTITNYTRYFRDYANVDADAHAYFVNQSGGTGAYFNLIIATNAGNTNHFMNSTTRNPDGGERGYTIRNDTGGGVRFMSNNGGFSSYQAIGTGGATYTNAIVNYVSGAGTGNIGTWNGYGFTLFCNTSQPSASQPAYGIVSNNYNTNFLISLSPGVRWMDIQVWGATHYHYYYGTMAAYLVGGGWVNVSDEREKEDIKDLKTSRSLERIMKCKPKYYKRKYYDTDKDGKPITPASQSTKDSICIGLLAQDVLQTNPHCVSGWKNDNIKETDDDDGTRYGINYGDFTVHLIGAVQEQQKQMDDLKNKLEKSQQDFDDYKKTMEARFDKLATMLQALGGSK